MCSFTSSRTRARLLGHHGDALAALQVLVARRLVEREAELRGIEEVEDDEVAAAVAEAGHRVQDGARLLVEVRDQHQDAAPMAGLAPPCAAGARSSPWRPASGAPSARSSVCRRMGRCRADGGTKSTTSSSKVTSPTRSRCLRER